MTDTVSATTELDAMSITDILAALPHRYPMLMIDRIVDIKGDDSAVGIKNVTFNEPIFQGHFPNNPIFPGVLILEGMAQTAGAIVIKYDASGDSKSIVMLLGIDSARFRKPAGPGDTIEYHISKLHRRRTVGRYRAEAKVDGVVIAEAELTAMIVEATE
ncbi:3-hydroxyacyl-ACP dehydratase FabZ [Devosia sp.]|jgi:3-hydroxyacyl-[acyl-carrier-protein] dehydratase|uniref:3-hydroxyacyl-ACP dehydratase FabZ n=1 Tax=Devosia sp. TaxID=1871048 RepID=UPI001AD0B4FF|nr:3-hydroxyacyl-ACP dehydratase FabZ [Devosia sp.]MBN9333252.1 3-hydroxyacyl-ACP dehydratase FabZ [Devosia sp.]